MTCDALCVRGAAACFVGATSSLAFLVGLGGLSVAANVASVEGVTAEGASAEGEWWVRCVGAFDRHTGVGFAVVGHGAAGRANCGSAGAGRGTVLTTGTALRT
jgi:hypothetical protein